MGVNSTCYGKRQGSDFSSSFVARLPVNGISETTEQTERFMDGVSYEYIPLLRFEMSFLLEISYAMCKHILTEFKLLRFDKLEPPRICISLHGIIQREYRIKRFLKSRCIYSSKGTATFNPSVISLILIRCGDIETQPGPITIKSTTSKKPKCPECSRMVAKNHKALCCSECTWIFHIKCVGLSMRSSLCQWTCYSCALPNFLD